MENVQVFLS